MKTRKIDDKDVIAVIFNKISYPFRTDVDGWLFLNGFNPDDCHIEESENAYRVCFHGLAQYDQQTMERRTDETNHGVTYIVAKPCDALKFQIEFGEDSLTQLLDDYFQILYSGSFKKYGMEFEINESVLDAMVSNFNKDVLKKKHLPIDYSHDNHQKAAGWITALKLGEDRKTLYAKAQWTPAGRQALIDREFSYFSAEFILSHYDAETKLDYGPVLRGGALTNIPFLKLPPIIPLHEDGRELSAIFFEEETKMTDAIKLATLESELKKRNDDYEAMKTQVNQLSTDLKVANDLVVRLSALETKNTELEKQLNLAKKNEEFGKLLSDGKACEAQRQAFIDGNVVEFAAKAEKINVITPTRGSDTADKVVLSENERDFYERNMKQRGVTEEQYIAMSRNKDFSVSYVTPPQVTQEGGGK